MSNLPPLPAGFELPALPEGFQMEDAAPAAPEDPNKVAARQWLEQHPAYKKQGAVSDYARMAGHGMSFGAYEPVVAGLAATKDMLTHGGNFSDYYGKERALQDAFLENARKNTGLAGTATEFAAGLGPWGALAKGANAVTTPFKASVLTGAAGSGLTAYNEGKDVGEGVGFGALGGAAGHAAFSGLGKVAGAFTKQPHIDSADAIKRAADQHAQSFANSGVQYSHQAMNRLGNEINSILQAERYNQSPELFPDLTRGGLDRMLQRLTRGTGVPGPNQRDPNDLLDLHQLMTSVGGRNPGSKDSRVAGLIKDKLGEFMENADYVPGDVLTGYSRVAADELGARNAEYVKFYKENALREALKTAEDRAAVSGVGGNKENTLRQEVRKLKNLRNDWTPDEMAQIDATDKGAAMQNFLRLLGRMSPDSNGLALMMHALGGPFMPATSIVSGAVGYGAKKLSQGMANRNAEDLSKIIRAGGQRSRAFKGPNRVQRALDTKRTVPGLLSLENALY